MTKSNRPGSLPREGTKGRGVRGGRVLSLPASPLVRELSSCSLFPFLFQPLPTRSSAQCPRGSRDGKRCSTMLRSKPAHARALPAHLGELKPDVRAEKAAPRSPAPPSLLPGHIAQRPPDLLSSRSTRAALKRFSKLSSVSVCRSRSLFS